MYERFKLMGGLGDCLVVAATLQKINAPLKFQTNELLNPIFAHHPTIHATQEILNPVFQFGWVSQMRNKDVYSMHTMHRFGHQIGIYPDPTEVLKIYDAYGKQKIHQRDEDTILINDLSAEHKRRYVPRDVLQLVKENFPEHRIEHIGRSQWESCQDIPQMIEKLLRCSFFVGPISFCYHLASCLRVPSLLCCGYMPEHKFSHFFNTETISMHTSCSFTCERDRGSCLEDCVIMQYDKDIVQAKIRIFRKRFQI